MRTLICLFVLLGAVQSPPAIAEPLTLGIIVHHADNIEAASSVGFTAIRLWDSGTSWSDLAAQPDVYRFEPLEAMLQASEQAHLRTVLVLGSTPRWASARPNESCAYGFGCAAEPADMENWRRYVAQVTKTYRGRIECYEPWNEVSFPSDPIFLSSHDGGDPGQFFSGSIDSLLSLVMIAYNEIKHNDPRACVLSPSFHSSGNWIKKFDLFLGRGGGRYLDVVSQHFYFPEEPEQVIPVIRGMRELMAAHGLSNVPLWNTEVGISFATLAKIWPQLAIDEIVHAIMLRTYLLNMSENVSRVYWYAFGDGVLGFSDSLTQVDFGSAAASAVAHLLAGVQKVRCSNEGNLWQCRAIFRDHQIRALWQEGKNVEPLWISLPAAATRWGRVPATLPAASLIALDGRPVLIEEHSE